MALLWKTVQMLLRDSLLSNLLSQADALRSELQGLNSRSRALNQNVYLPVKRIKIKRSESPVHTVNRRIYGFAERRDAFHH
jgi:hypothetical protein